MPEPFSGRVALVTGASGGNGAAVAELFAARGAAVAATDLCEAGLAPLARRGLLTLTGDLTAAEDCARVVAATQARCGRLDILVNVAGDYTKAPIETMSADAWRAMFDVNLTSTFEMMRAVLAPMRAAGGGRIVNIASIDAYLPKPTLVHYAAAKAGVVSLTRSFAEAYAREQILVNGVAPGPVATPRAKREEWLEAQRDKCPLGRVAEPEDIAEIVAFLASDANRCITGETIVASCGMLMR
jgi:NAD(P)-dependent dehydrogenase (short-subunit alcohol dehydrogenase family)